MTEEVGAAAPVGSGGRRVTFAASIMCSGFRNLEAEVHALAEAGIEWLHLDVMDGHFVPNYGLGVDLIRELISFSPLPGEVHLMVARPELGLERFSGMGVRRIIFHVEATHTPLRLIERAREAYPEVWVAVNPATPLGVLDYCLEAVDGVCLMSVEPGFAGQRFVANTPTRIQQLRQMAEAQHPGLLIEVDGQVNLKTVRAVVMSGADVLVVGTSGLYRDPLGFRAALKSLKEAIAGS